MSDIQGVSVKLYNQGEQQLHKAAQLLALTGDNLLATLPDESQSTLNVNPLVNRLEGRKFSIKGLTYILSIDLAEFSLELLDDQQGILRTKSFINSTYNEMEIAWRQWFKDLGVEQELSNTLGYELSPKLQSLQTFKELSKGFVDVWYGMRLSAVQSLNELTQMVGIDSEINIWPHHFDTGTYYAFNEPSNKSSFAIGAGLAVADELLNEPYYYIYGYSSDGRILYDKLPPLSDGKWLTDSWKGAILSLSELESPDSNKIRVFFNQASKYLLTFK